MPIEIVPKPKAKPKVIINIFFYLSIVILILSIGAYFGLNFIKEEKDQELEDIKAQIVEQETNERLRMREDLKRSAEKVDQFSLLLDSRRYPLKFFDFLASKTHQRVMWTSVNLDLLEGKLMLAGKTDSLGNLIRQILVFEAESRIKEFELTSFALGEKGGVSMNFTISLSPRLFKD